MAYNHKEIEQFVRSIIARIDNASETEKADNIVLGLRMITDEYTTENYEFNIAMEIFAELLPQSYVDISEQLLENELDKIGSEFEKIEKEHIFALFYALSLIYKKTDNDEKLKKLADRDDVGQRYSIFDRYPLYYEVCSRYNKRCNRFIEAIENDRKAIRKTNGANHGVRISYAATICRMLERCPEEINEDWLANAKLYIDEAIEANPLYPKYHYLKAKWIIYREFPGCCSCDVSALEAAALNEIDMADDNLDDFLSYRKGNYIEKERKKYERLKALIRKIAARKRKPRFCIDNAVLDELKNKILGCENQDLCVSESYIPPIPVYGSDDKYFFICYASADFKSVYCDIIEFYKNKLPFRYDERLTHGVNWEKQIESYIMPEECAGVIFYISKNTLLSTAVNKEIEIVKKYNKKFFCVNLEGSMPPSKIVIESILDYGTYERVQSAIPTSSMKNFMFFFGDDDVFAHKFREHGNDGIRHFKALNNAIRDRFPEINDEIWGD